MKKSILFIVSVFILNCSNKTTIINSWKDPEANEKHEAFQKVLIVALIKDKDVRRVVENRIASSKPVFRTSYELLNENNFNLSKEQKIQILKDENFDSVISIRLIKYLETNTYNINAKNINYYNYAESVYEKTYGVEFVNWYKNYANDFYDPNYNQPQILYLTEITVFSLKQNKIVWKTMTKSINKNNLDKTIDELIKSVISQMKKDKFLN